MSARIIIVEGASTAGVRAGSRPQPLPPHRVRRGAEGARAGSQPRPMPPYRVRRRTAGFTALGTTLAALTAIAVGGPDLPASAAPGAGRPSAIEAELTQDLASTARERRQAEEKTARAPVRSAPRYPRVLWRDSRAIGKASAGSLTSATKLPVEGSDFVTWDPERRRTPSPAWRRYGTDRLVRVILRVAGDYARANPGAPRLTIGDLSRRRGGRFAGRHSAGSLHASHQNGLDADIYYPRRDRRERAPRAVSDVNIRLSQDLVDRFVRAGAQYVFVGLNTPLRGPGGVVMRLANHDNHLHVRLTR